MNKEKVILIDFSIFMFRAIFSKKFSNTIIQYPPYNCLSMMMSCLKCIELTPDDTIIIAMDSSKGSWRRQIDSSYKKDREEKRNSTSINWEKEFADFNSLIENLKISTPFYCIEINKLEADDIIAYATRYFKDKECVIISSDSDFEQLTIFPNVSLFSDKKKKYKLVKNPSKILASKIYKEVTDGLTASVETKKDYEKRNLIVNLTTLPKEVEEKVEEELKTIDNKKDFSLEKLKFNKIKERFLDIYNNDKIVTVKSTLKSLVRKQKKNQENKYKQTKLGI